MGLVEKVITIGVAGLFIIVFVIAFEAIRETEGDNPIVNDTINMVEGQLGVEPTACSCGGWFWAFIITLVILLAVITAYLFSEYYDTGRL